MKLSKVLFSLMIVSVLLFTVAFASENVLTKDNNLDKSAEEVVTKSGEELVATSGEEAVATSGEEVVATSGEEAVVTSGDEAVVASGEEVVATSGEEVVVSGDEVAPVSGDEAEVASGDEVIANDVKSGDWFFPFVKDALDLGIMSVDEDGNFNPNRVATREEAFDTLTNAFETSYSLNTENPEEFLAVETTREEVAYIVYLYAQSVDLGFKDSWMFLLDFEDREDVSEEAYEAMAWCVMNEIIIGRPDNTLAPQDTATRAELATIMVRLSNFMETV